MRGEAAKAGHFTTMQARDGRVQGRDLHLARLLTASRSLYGASPGRSVLRRRIREALAAAGQETGDCTVRVRVLPSHPGACKAGGPGAQDPQLRIKVDIEPPREPPASPLRVRTHPGLRAVPCVKHLALDFQLKARAQAREAGFDDALLLAADGRISEGTFWNVVFWDGEAVVWPDAPALAGVTRQLLRTALDQAGLPQRCEALDTGSLGGFCAAFALNSSGIGDIAAIDGHAFPGDARVGALLRRLLAAVPRDPL
ncbi:aminotransferase class IV [Luteimonas sp. A478]